MQKLRMAILGCGRISYKHIEAIVQNKEEIELVAVCDLVESRAIDRKNQYEQTISDSNVAV